MSNTNIPTVYLVIEDLLKRKEAGIKAYGKPLHANNGRDALQDAYEEALDLAQYLKQAIDERNEKKEMTRHVKNMPTRDEAYNEY